MLVPIGSKVTHVSGWTGQVVDYDRYPDTGRMFYWIRVHDGVCPVPFLPYSLEEFRESFIQADWREERGVSSICWYYPPKKRKENA